MLRHWSQFVSNMSTDIRGHETLLHHFKTIHREPVWPSGTVYTIWPSGKVHTAGRKKGHGSIPLWLSLLFKKVVVRGVL